MCSSDLRPQDQQLKEQKLVYVLSRESVSEPAAGGTSLRTSTPLFFPDP